MQYLLTVEERDTLVKSGAEAGLKYAKALADWYDAKYLNLEHCLLDAPEYVFFKGTIRLAFERHQRTFTIPKPKLEDFIKP